MFVEMQGACRSINLAEKTNPLRGRGVLLWIATRLPGVSNHALVSAITRGCNPLFLKLHSLAQEKFVITLCVLVFKIGISATLRFYYCHCLFVLDQSKSLTPHDVWHLMLIVTITLKCC